MTVVADIVLAFIALEHLAFLVLEMFLWTHRIGRRIFGQTRESAELTKVLAANQGLYNGFLAAGLVWGIVSGSWTTKVFFASCVLVAGIFGGLTAKRSILVVQALPAALALLLLIAVR